MFKKLTITATIASSIILLSAFNNHAAAFGNPDQHVPQSVAGAKTGSKSDTRIPAVGNTAGDNPPTLTPGGNTAGDNPPTLTPGGNNTVGVNTTDSKRAAELQQKLKEHFSESALNIKLFRDSAIERLDVKLKEAIGSIESDKKDKTRYDIYAESNKVLGEEVENYLGDANKIVREAGDHVVGLIDQLNTKMSAQNAGMAKEAHEKAIKLAKAYTTKVESNAKKVLNNLTEVNMIQISSNPDVQRAVYAVILGKGYTPSNSTNADLEVKNALKNYLISGTSNPFITK